MMDLRFFVTEKHLTPLRVKLAFGVAGLMLLGLVGLLIYGAIKDPITFLLLAGILGGFSVVMWSAVTIADYFDDE
jgi:hypothetical protein